MSVQLAGSPTSRFAESMSAASVGHGEQTASRLQSPTTRDDAEFKKVFQTFVAGTLFGQMLKAMRKSQGEVAYFGGSSAEKVFQGQLDQQLSEQLADEFGGPLSQSLFRAYRSQRESAQDPINADREKQPVVNPAAHGEIAKAGAARRSLGYA